MDQNIDNRHKEILWDLLANPAENGQLYKHNLERLVQDNPQSGLLQVMYARSLKTPDIRKAAAYFSPKALHKLMHDPDGLLPVSRDRVNKAFNGSQATEPENYFNIGEAAEVISDAPVAEAESLVTQDIAPPVANVASTEAFAPELDEQQLLPEHQEENTFALPPEGSTAESAYQTPAPEAQEEPTYDTPPPVTQAEDTYDQQVLQTESVYPSSAPEDDDEDAFANPWDLSKLEDTEEIAISEPEAEQVQENITEALPEPEPEKTPEPEAVKASEAQPEQTESVAVFTPAEPQIETYDHSLSAFEQHAVNEADAPEPTEVSSFESYYRPENVFHKQDDIEDEVYDEIVSIDEIGVESLGNKFAEDPEEAPVESTEPGEEATAEQQSYIDDETEKLIYGNIAATDYLSFDKKLDELRAGATAQSAPIAEATVPQAQPVVEAPVTPPAPQALPQIAEATKEPDIISKYNDDTLPYSFMWWLDKTRKEHAGVNQPYAEPVRPELQQPAPSANDIKNNAPDELQQQYYTNIFNLTSVSSIGEIEPPQIEFDHNKKEDIIIERFIHTDPQIKPLAADKLDNENKAKKSSEDQDAMVTETLARIYGDQMLYHKAIATYKKLMLKIPEKKLYFAAQIEQLEKKIN